MVAPSSNFELLKAYDAQLVRLGALAERYFKDDPNASRNCGSVHGQLTLAATVTVTAQNDFPGGLACVGS